MDECQAQLKTVQTQLLTVTEEAERLKPMLREKRDLLSVAKQALRAAQVQCLLPGCCAHEQGWGKLPVWRGGGVTGVGLLWRRRGYWGGITVEAEGLLGWDYCGGRGVTGVGLLWRGYWGGITVEVEGLLGWDYCGGGRGYWGGITGEGEGLLGWDYCGGRGVTGVGLLWRRRGYWGGITGEGEGLLGWDYWGVGGVTGVGLLGRGISLEWKGLLWR